MNHTEAHILLAFLMPVTRGYLINPAVDAALAAKLITDNEETAERLTVKLLKLHSQMARDDGET